MKYGFIIIKIERSLKKYTYSAKYVQMKFWESPFELQITHQSNTQIWLIFQSKFYGNRPTAGIECKGDNCVCIGNMLI